jgi:hypothetical protein
MNADVRLPKYSGGTTLRWTEHYGAAPLRFRERGRDVLFSLAVVFLVYGAMSLAVMDRPSTRIASAIVSFFAL